MKSCKFIKEQLKPDFGEFYLKTFGEVPIKLVVARENSTLMRVGRTFYVSFLTGTHIGTIEMPALHKQQAEVVYQKLLTSGLMVQVKPLLRYWAEINQEWVIPFYVIESLPLPIPAQTQLSKAEEKRQRRAAKQLKQG